MTTIYQAIVAVAKDIGAIAKTRQNESQRWSYRSIEDVYNRAAPLFAHHGVFSVPEVLEKERIEGSTKSGGTMYYAILTVKYTFFAEDGSSVACTVVGEGMDSGDKASNKAMAAAHKYAICQILNIPYDVVDPDQFSPEWIRRSDGKISKSQYEQLKRDWYSPRAEALTGVTPEDIASSFKGWAQEVAPFEGDHLNWRAWTLDAYHQAQQHLTDEQAQEKAQGAKASKPKTTRATA